MPRGREVRRLAKKMGALMRDYSPSSSLEAFQVEEARLRLWVRRVLFAAAVIVVVVFSHRKRAELSSER